MAGNPAALLEPQDVLAPALTALMNRAGMAGRPSFRAAAVRLECLTPARADCFLTAAEKPFYPGGAALKRQREWLGGRLAAKEALNRLCPGAGSSDRWQRWSVTADGSGRPLARASSGETVPVSISHSGDRAVALAAGADCGIDLQVITPQVDRVRERFSRPKEQERLQVLSRKETAALTLLWAAKEALRKALPVRPPAAFLELQLISAQPLPEGGWSLEFRFRHQAGVIPVAGFFHDRYAGAMTVLDPASAGEFGSSEF